MEELLKTRRLKQARKDLDMTKSELARKAGLQPNVVGWTEEGRYIPYQGQLEKIAAALGWDGDPLELLEEI